MFVLNSCHCLQINRARFHPCAVCRAAWVGLTSCCTSQAFRSPCFPPLEVSLWLFSLLSLSENVNFRTCLNLAGLAGRVAAVPEVTDGARPFRPARSPCPEGPGRACAPRGGATRRGRRCKGRGEVAGPPSRPGSGGAACPGIGGRGETVCGAQVRGAARGLVRALGARPSGDRWGGGCGGASDGRGRAGRVARP